MGIFMKSTPTARSFALLIALSSSTAASPGHSDEIQKRRFHGLNYTIAECINNVEDVVWNEFIVPVLPDRDSIDDLTHLISIAAEASATRTSCNVHPREAVRAEFIRRMGTRLKAVDRTDIPLPLASDTPKPAPDSRYVREGLNQQMDDRSMAGPLY